MVVAQLETSINRVSDSAIGATLTCLDLNEVQECHAPALNGHLLDLFTVCQGLCAQSLLTIKYAEH